MYILFGIKTGDAEVARSWIEAAVGVAGEARTNDYNGDYYTFKSTNAERAKLISGICQDEDGAYPAEANFPDRKLLLYLDNIRPESAWLKAIENLPQKFEKLRTDLISEPSR